MLSSEVSCFECHPSGVTSSRGLSYVGCTHGYQTAVPLGLFLKEFLFMICISDKAPSGRDLGTAGATRGNTINRKRSPVRAKSDSRITLGKFYRNAHFVAFKFRQMFPSFSISTISGLR
jgi:hypothetical protein